jgi:hypothetical protein
VVLHSRHDATLLEIQCNCFVPVLAALLYHHNPMVRWVEFHLFSLPMRGSVVRTIADGQLEGGRPRGIRGNKCLR